MSTAEQHLDGQVRLLLEHGADAIYQEHGSGGDRERPELARLVADLVAGDVLVVTKLDRLGRTLVHLLGLLDELKGKGVGFRSIGEAVDTTTPAGRLMMQMLGAFAEFERSLVLERTLAGLEAARQRGTKLGRRPSLSAKQVKHIQKLVEKGVSQAEAARLFRVSRSTVCRALKP